MPIQFLHILLADGRKVYNILTVTPAAPTAPVTLNDVYNAFDAYYAPYKNLSRVRHHLLTTRQRPQQPIDDFIMDLKTRFKGCGFDAVEDELLSTLVVCGVRDDTLRRRLLAVKSLTLPDAIDLCRAEQYSGEHATAIASHSTPPQPPPLVSSTNALDTIHSYAPQYSRSHGPVPASNSRYSRLLHHEPGQSRSFGTQPSGPFVRPQLAFFRGGSPSGYGRPPSHNQFGPRNGHTQPGMTVGPPCSRSGTRHPPQRCPAYGSRCYRCNGLNHWAPQCQSVHALSKDITPNYALHTPDELPDPYGYDPLITDEASYDDSPSWTEPPLPDDDYYYYRNQTPADFHLVCLIINEISNPRSSD